ncbi:uncharacterized protein FA14DRAFT_154383 [Meira miltonrushii]|uniref:Uncharacterized protein n=1 Tax=Meira miltonrushii TaxID=1280837 RepID=A0A316VBC6_9BASI|nr:uncharacterized protein FA14DRAFT_154383 [Meira miltonrushii]PWN34947.1 hypothetical protein FA14DRAFT_154383 [Meira miltonrushii]
MTKVLLVGAVNKDVSSPTTPSGQVFFTPDLNGPPPSSDDELATSKDANQPHQHSYSGSLLHQRAQGILKVQDVTPKVEARRKRQRKYKAKIWKNLSVEEKRRILSVRNAKRSERYHNLPEEEKEIERAKSRQKQKKSHDKDPIRHAAYQKKYRKDHPEKAKAWERNREEKRKALREEKKKATLKALQPKEDDKS